MGKALSGELSSMQIDIVLVLFLINLSLLNKIGGTEYQASCLKIMCCTAAHHAEEFLKREWLGKDGEKEKGAKFNEQLQIVVK